MNLQTNNIITVALLSATIFVSLVLTSFKMGNFTSIPFILSFVWFMGEGAYRNLKPMDLTSIEKYKAEKQSSYYWLIKFAVMMLVTWLFMKWL